METGIVTLCDIEVVRKEWERFVSKFRARKFTDTQIIVLVEDWLEEMAPTVEVEEDEE